MMWYCGDRPKKVPPYRMLRGVDLKNIKGGKLKLAMMRKLMEAVERAAKDFANNRGGNKSDLIVKNREWTKSDCINLYDVTQMRRKDAMKQLFGKLITTSWSEESGGYMVSKRGELRQ